MSTRPPAPTRPLSPPAADRSAPAPEGQPPADTDKHSILVVDDDFTLARGLQRLLTRAGYLVDTAEDARTAIRKGSANPYNLALVDYNMPGMFGHEIIADLRKVSPNTTFIAITGEATSEVALRMMQMGARDLVEKPILDYPAFFAKVQAACEASAASLRRPQHREADQHIALQGLVGKSPAMMRLREQILQAASVDCPVLITGESGVGKTEAARALHLASHRARHPFVAQNMAAVSADLAESELFGHERGAFSGAYQCRAGLFDRAHLGSLFLYEFGELLMTMQPKLLTVLEDKSVRRLGSAQTQTVDFRIVAATNVELDAAVAARAFREDLRSRLEGFWLRIPPLRERREDIPLLVWHAVHQLNPTLRRSVRSISTKVLAALEAQEWRRSNIRELNNVVQQAMIACPPGHHRLEPEHLPDRLHAPGAPPPGAAALAPATDEGPALPGPPDDFDLRWLDLPWASARSSAEAWFKALYLQHVLGAHDNNITHAAAAAGVDRANLHRMMRQVGVEVQKHRKVRG